MDIEKLPNLKSETHPRRVTIALREIDYDRLQLLKSSKNIDPSTLCRLLVQEFIEENMEFFESDKLLGN